MNIYIKYAFFAGVALTFSGCSSHQTSKPFNQNAHYSQELKAIRREKFKKGKLLNKSEMDLLLALENALYGKGYRIIFQTSLGSFLNHSNKDMFLKINCKRADFVIVNRFGYPEVVVEYNGEGHFSSSSYLRDDIKETACSSAEVPFVSISYHEKRDLKRAIEEKVLPRLFKRKTH